MRLLKNAYEQNLARCIAAAQGADFFSFLTLRVNARTQTAHARFTLSPSYSP